MKIYISVDMEGIGGTFSWDHEDAERSSVKKYFTEQIEWVIEGIQKSKINSKIEEIVIADSHSKCDSISYDITAMDDRLHIISGWKRPQYMMPALDNTYDMVFFIGYHSYVGEMYGCMDHSYSGSSVYNIFINDIPVSETLINAAYAGYYNIPVGFIVGDDALRKELIDEEQMPWVIYVSTKTALGRYSTKNRPKNIVKNETIKKVIEVLGSDLKKIPVYKFEKPYSLRIQLVNTAMADMVDLLPMVKRLDGRTVEYITDDYKELLDMIMVIIILSQKGNS